MLESGAKATVEDPKGAAVAMSSAGDAVRRRTDAMPAQAPLRRSWMPEGLGSEAWRPRRYGWVFGDKPAKIGACVGIPYPVKDILTCLVQRTRCERRTRLLHRPPRYLW